MRSINIAHIPRLLVSVSLPAARRSLVAVCAGALIASSASVLSIAQESAASAGPALAFDIPAQPLAAALDAYTAITGKEGFYDGSAGIGRRSREVKGVFTPDDALRILLSNTDLSPLPSGSSGYTLALAAEVAGRAAAAARMAADRPYMDYFAMIQTDIRNALCRDAERRPEQYLLIVKLWIGSSGAIKRAEHMGTTGDPGREARLAATLHAATLDEPPPPGMPQPITMAIFPGRQAGADGCRDSADRGLH